MAIDIDLPHLNGIRTHNISSDRHRLHSIAQRGYIISFCQYIWRIMVPHLKEIWSDFIDLHCGEKQNQESAQILYWIWIKSFRPHITHMTIDIDQSEAMMLIGK
jgi:hypothetical protein